MEMKVKKGLGESEQKLKSKQRAGAAKQDGVRADAVIFKRGMWPNTRLRQPRLVHVTGEIIKRVFWPLPERHLRALSQQNTQATGKT